MKRSKFNIEGNDASIKTKEFLLKHYKDGVIREFDFGLVIWNEHYYGRTNSNLLYTINLNTTNKDKAIVEIISGGGGVGFFNLSWWSEKDTITIVWKDLSSFCKKTELSIEGCKIEKL
jgi:hypothetical protein